MKFSLVVSLFISFIISGCEAKSENYSQEKDKMQLLEFKEIADGNDEIKQKSLFQKIQKNAENGDSTAQNLLGVVYENGYLGQNEDIENAITWYKKSAENGNGIAENNIGNLYYRGQGVEKNDELAYEFYNKSMQKKVPEAINSIGLMYFKNKKPVKKERV